MKVNFKEYEQMAVQFNFYHYRWLLIGMPFITSVCIFLVLSFDDRDYFMNFIFSVFFGILYNYASKKMIEKSAKQVNRTKKIVTLETTVEKEKIIETVYQENDVETRSEYSYTDIIKVKEDKYNFYLYITNKSVIIISKQKLENIETFRTIIKEKCVMIKK